MEDHTPNREARAPQGPDDITAAVPIKPPEKNIKKPVEKINMFSKVFQQCSEDEAYHFFCHDPDRPKEKEPVTSSQETGSDTAIDIADVVECYNLNLRREAAIRDTDVTQSLFVPSDLPVLQRRTLPANRKPRFLEEEGLYVRERPQVPRKMINKMENRLIEQEQGQRWFGENGCIIALPEPIQKYWRCKVDFPFASQPPLTTAYMRPVTQGAAVTGTQRHEGMWQLDLSLFALVFTHHPLFSAEHVLAQCLLELYEHYQIRKTTDVTASLQDKLRGLKKSETALIAVKETIPVPPSKIRELREEIKKTSVVLNEERRADLALVRRIVTAWKRIKALRTKNGFVSTTVKLQMHRVKLKDTGSSANMTESADGDVTIKQHYLSPELRETEHTHAQPPPAQDPPSQGPESSDLIPVLTTSGVVTPTPSCPPDEKVRRYELAHRRISVNIFYNKKHVSASEPVALDHGFRADIQQMFNMQIVHSPEDIVLEICESAKGRRAVLAEVCVPIPDRNMMTSSAAVESSEFSSVQTVRPYYRGVGSNVPFGLDEDEPRACLLTSGRLLYCVSWAVDDTGFPMAPAVSSHGPSFPSVMRSCDNNGTLQWIGDRQFDPNHPANAELAQLLRDAGEQRRRPGRCFRRRALEEEFDFATEEQLDKSRRFSLLQLRSAQAVGIAPSTPVPLHDRDITDDMFEEYADSSSLSFADEDPITWQRSLSLHCVEKLLNLARKRMLNVKRRYNLSDIVREHQGQDTVIEFNWDTCRRPRPLNPKRAARESAPAGALADGDLKIRVRVSDARGLPVRREARLEEIRARDSCCEPVDGRRNTPRGADKVAPQARVRPFVEVRFQGAAFESSVEQGPRPCWTDEFSLDFRSPGGDYSQSGLSRVQDSIVINVFDEISLKVIESSSVRGCGTQLFSGRQWLGSVTVPFTTMLQQSEVCETLSISTPVMLLGYTWTEDGFHDDGGGVDIRLDRDHSYLDVFIALDPPISLRGEPSPKDEFQKQLWLFPSEEAEPLLDRAHGFERRGGVATGGGGGGRRKRVVTTVVNSEGRLVLATRFFRPLPPPREVSQVTPGNGRLAVLERVAAFVSLIPVLSVPSDVGDCGDMWFTSEQCLELVMGNSVSLAVLLCNFFDHLGSKAWLVMGTSVTEGDTTYVLTREGAWYLLWNPRDGQHHRSDARCPLQSVDCLVNGENVWLNSQPTKRTRIMNFDVTDIATWSRLFPRSLEAESSVPLEIRYRPPNKDLVGQLQRRMELKLKNCVMDWRSPHPTRWSHSCSAMLSQALRHLEESPAPFVAIETELDKMLGAMQDYKVTGFPIHMAYRDMDSVVQTVFNTRVHSTEIPGTEFALGIYIHPYPNHVLSVWIFLATLVKHQRGIFYAGDY